MARILNFKIDAEEQEIIRLKKGAHKGAFSYPEGQDY